VTPGVDNSYIEDNNFEEKEKREEKKRKEELIELRRYVIRQLLTT
jgi:hypothetical protein